jgi:hypothetical protein
LYWVARENTERVGEPKQRHDYSPEPSSRSSSFEWNESSNKFLSKRLLYESISQGLPTASLTKMVNLKGKSGYDVLEGRSSTEDIDRTYPSAS